MLTLLLRTTPAFIRWVISTLLSWLAVILAVVLSPIAAFFAYKGEGGHWYLPKIFKWMTTHDATMEVHWYNGHPKKRRWFHKYPIDAFEKTWWLRYVCFVDWIFTNPAYNVKQYLGFDQKGMQLLYKRDEGKYWDSGYNNFSFWISKNAKGQHGFMLQFQYFYYKTRCIEFYWGWKLFRTDPDRRCMIATRITPFFSYVRKTEEEIERGWEETRYDREIAEEFWRTGKKPW